MWREGMQSLFLLWAAFYDTVFQTESSAIAFADSNACFHLAYRSSNVQDDDDVISRPQTRFYLGFGDREQELDINGSSGCAGSDWVGE